MRLRLGLILAAVFASLLSPVAPTASAFGGYASAPLSVSATAIAGGIRMVWSAPVDVDTGITGYRIEYSTSGMSGSWNFQTTVASTTYLYDFAGLAQSATYVRVAATTAAGTGTYGYPWTKLYGTTNRNRLADASIGYESGYGLGSTDPYNALEYSSFSRVKYRLDTTLSSNGASEYAEADFYNWANTGDSTQTTNASSNASVKALSIPTTLTYSHIVHANVSDLNVYSNNSAVLKGKGLAGRLEIWPGDYGYGPSGLSPAGSSASHDYDDNPVNGSYGSFQVHDLTNTRAVFVWNHHGYGQLSDLNYGVNSTANAFQDSTFCGQNTGQGTCPSYSYFRLQIFANIPVTPLADTTGPTVSRIDSRLLGKNGDTITVRSNEGGYVYLVNQSVSVSNFSNISSAAAADKNSVAVSAYNHTTLTLTSLNSGTYKLYAADVFNNLSTAILATIRVDNTAPTATSIEVNSAGTAIVLTASETITNSSQVLNTYSISDSGSAISVIATSFSGNVATITLNRSIPAGASVTFAYTPSGGAATGRWKDEAGNEMAAITTRSITNSSGAAITVTLSIPDSISKGLSVTITASVSVAGKVTFLIAGKRIPGCLNKVASGTTPITISCTFKPALTAQQTIKATLVPTLGAYPTTSAQASRYILKRTTTR